MNNENNSTTDIMTDKTTEEQRPTLRRQKPKTVSSTRLDTPAQQRATTKSTYQKQPDTLCFTCEHCTCADSPDFESLSRTLPDGRVSHQRVCPWAAQFKPVPGWTAERHDVKTFQNKIEESYFVIACPFYKPDLEGQILAMPREKMRLLLGLPYRFIDGHKKLSIQLGVEYVKAIKQFRTQRGIKELTREEKYKIREAVIKQHKFFAQCDIESLEEIRADSLDGKLSYPDQQDYNNAIFDIEACDKALKALKRTEEHGFAPAHEGCERYLTNKCKKGENRNGGRTRRTPKATAETAPETD